MISKIFSKMFQIIPSFVFFVFLIHLQALSADLGEEITEVPKELLLDEPSSFVNNSVNVISGHYHENVVDLEVAGPHPLFFQRSHSSGHGGNLCMKWSSNHYGKAYIPRCNDPFNEDLHKHSFYHTTVSGDCGHTISYEGSRNKSTKVLSELKVNEEQLQKYITNCGNQNLSPGSHVRNSRFLFRKNSDDMILTTGNGFRRYYENKSNTEEGSWGKKRYFTLSREEHPHNYSIKYSKKKISLQNSQRNELSSIEKIYSAENQISKLVGSDGRWVKYHYLEERKKDKLNPALFYLYMVEGSDIPTQSYEYEYSKIIRKNLPEGRFLGTAYYRSNEFGGRRDYRVGRVKHQFAPVGTDATPIVTHGFVYNQRVEEKEFNDRILLDGYTSVYDAYLNRTDYHFNDDYRITEIVKWEAGNICVHSKERSFWGKNDTNNSTNLVSKSLANAHDETKLCRFYVYDDHGNPTMKFLCGNLTGKCDSNIIIDKENGLPTLIPGVNEWHAKTCTYYTDLPLSPNLLLSESDGKKIAEYHYQPFTSLNTAKFIKVDEAIKKREFNAYDGNRCLQSIVVDDGSSISENDLASVTERRITSIYNRTTAPIGLPQIIDQKYLDQETNEHILLGRVINTHSKTGQILTQEHYDSEYTLKFTLEWEYDSKGNLISEKDALGRVITKKYDLNKNLVYQEGPLPGVYTEFQYDFVNRLIGIRECHPDGVQLTQSFRYDYLSNKIASIDPYGQETRYIYDNQNRLIQTIFPAVFNENMVLIQPTTLIEYDLFDNPCKITDAAGGITTIFYTAYNKPYFKNYPDGTAEAFEYDISGNLVKSIAQNGTTTLYQYDAFDRLIKKDIYSLHNEFVQTETNTYNAFHLLSKTDPAGNVTNFQYDQAGRLISVIKGEMRIEHQYDASGRESKVLTFHGVEDDAYTATVKEYDHLDRLIEERVEDSSGNVLIKGVYDYDLSGNRNLVRTYNQAGESNSYTEYNTRGQPVLITTATGEQTRIHYRYDYYDPELGQNLPYSETIDPKGVVTACIKDAAGRDKTVYKKDAFGKLLQKRNYYYNPKGLLSRTVDEVIVDGESQSNITNICRYNSAGQLIETRESEGTPEQKITKFQYNSFGQKEVEIKPDGTTLHCSYDVLGRLKEYYASDNSFHYHYKYDANSNLTCILDQVQGTQTVRSYDQHDRLKKEILANGLSLQYSYDLSGKPIKMVFPDGSGMALSYDSLFLKKISRLDQQGKEIYSHTYNSYDLSGNVIESTLIGNAGKMCYATDLKGRMSRITSDAWSSSIQYDPTGNIRKKTFQDPLGSHSCEYKYDELDQLIEENGNFSEKYVNDSLYNRVKKGSLDYAVNALNQVTSDGKNAYRYDLNGNLIFIDDGTTQIKLVYDALNRLIEVEKDDQRITYVYDPMNRRISKTIFGRNEQKTFKYFYQDLNEIGCYEDEKLVELRLLGIGKGAEIGAAVAIELNKTVYAPIHDTHGNVICLIDANSGKIQEFYRYSAFGEELLFDQNGDPLQAAINPWRFSSKRTDAETGFVYFGRRYYDSNLGRWITPDPIGFEGGPNLYAYVMNNPLTNIDLYGLSAEDSSLGARSERNFMSDVRDFFVSVYEGVRDCVASIGRSIGDGLSQCSAYLSDRFSSSNELREIRFSQKMFESAMNKTLPVSFIAGVGAYMGTFFTNGIQNTAAEAKASAEYIANIGGGQVDGVYNPSNSVFNDICRAFHSLKCYLSSNVVPELHKTFDKHFETYGLEKPLLVICHSEGAINVRNALMSYDPELRKMIDVLAIAPAAYIDRHLCRSVHHYVSTRDIVPWFDFSGRIRNSETVHVLKAHKDASFLDHSFQSPTYARVITDHVTRHKIKNGY